VFLRFLLRFMLYFAVVVAITYFDVLGTSSALREQSTVILNRTLGDQHRDQPQAARPPDGVSVVLINERSLHNFAAQGAGGSDSQLALTWPIQLHHHAKVLDEIREQDPHAVFVDLLFKDKRDGDLVEQLNKTIRRYQKDGTPLFFGVANENLIRSDIKNLSDENYANINLLNETDNPFPDSTFDVIYPRADQEPFDEERDSAAFKIYKETRGERPELPNMKSDMVVFWDNSPARFNVEHYENLFNDEDCQDAQRFGWPQKLIQAFFDPDDLHQPCPPFPVAPAEFLAFDLAEEEDRLNDTALTKLIEDRVVFYGANLIGLGDIVESPIHGGVPGVYFHASAYRNLLHFGADFKKNAESLRSHVCGEKLDCFGQKWIWIDARSVELAVYVVMIALMLLVFWPHLEVHARPQRRGVEPRHDHDDNAVGIFTWRYIMFFLSSFVVVGGVTLFAFYILNLGRINFIEMLGTISLVGAFAANRIMDRFVAFCCTVLNPAPGERAADEGEGVRRPPHRRQVEEEDHRDATG